MDEINIEIVCPKCEEKAAFFANSWRSSLTSQPSYNGKIICTHCCYNQANFSRKDIIYYYVIPIQNRFLFARTLADLISLRDYFKNYFTNNKKHHYFGKFYEPEQDFPSIFYKHRLALIARIEKRIAQEIANI